MAHVAKFNRAATGHMLKHYDRQGHNIGNENIKPERTKENYNLAPNREISQGDFIKQRCSEIRTLNRKDVNVMCTWIVTQPQGLPKNQRKQFFQETYTFLTNRYGSENVISAYVHMDEITPHMHFAFVPVTLDKKRNIEKLSAKEVITREDLRTFHTDLEKHMEHIFGYEIGIQNEATREGNRSIRELKREDALKTHEKALQEAEHAKRVLHAFQDKKEALERQINALKAIPKLERGLPEGKENLLGTKISFDKSDAKLLLKSAKRYRAMNLALKEARRDAIEARTRADHAESLITGKENAALREKIAEIVLEHRQILAELKNELSETEKKLERLTKAISQHPEIQKVILKTLESIEIGEKKWTLKEIRQLGQKEKNLNTIDQKIAELRGQNTIDNQLSRTRIRDREMER